MVAGRTVPNAKPLHRVNVHPRGRLTVGSNCILRGSLIVGDGCELVIGDNVTFNRQCFVRAWEESRITIGSGSLLSDVTIETSDMHSVVDIESGRRLNPARDIEIGEHCWIGSGVLILGGARIGSNSVVAARAVVKHEFQPNVLIAGVPGRQVKSGITWDRRRL